MTFLSRDRILELLDGFEYLTREYAKLILSSAFGLMRDEEETDELHRGFYHRSLTWNGTPILITTAESSRMLNLLWHRFTRIERLHLYTCDFPISNGEIEIFKRTIVSSPLADTFPILTKFKCYNPYEFPFEIQFFKSVYNFSFDELVQRKLLQFDRLTLDQMYFVTSSLLHESMPDWTVDQLYMFLRLYGVRSLFRQYRKILITRWLDVTRARLNVNWLLS